MSHVCRRCYHRWLQVTFLIFIFMSWCCWGVLPLAVTGITYQLSHFAGWRVFSLIRIIQKQNVSNESFQPAYGVLEPRDIGNIQLRIWLLVYSRFSLRQSSWYLSTSVMRRLLERYSGILGDKRYVRTGWSPANCLRGIRAYRKWSSLHLMCEGSERKAP